MLITYDKKTEIKNLAGIIEHEAKKRDCDVEFILKIIERLYSARQEVLNENKTNQ